MAPEKRKADSFSSRSDATSFLGIRSSAGKSQGVLKRLLIIFCLLGLTSIGVNVKFLLDSNAAIHEHLVTSTGGPTKWGIEAPGERLATLLAERRRLAVLLGITVICFGSVVYLFVKKAVAPVRIAAQTARDLSRGNLSVSALKNPQGDLGELGEALNDLAANFQEILLLMGTTVGNSFSTIERIEKVLEAENAAPHEEIRTQLDDVKKDLILLRSLVQEFDFYETRFDGRKVVSGSTGRES